MIAAIFALAYPCHYAHEVRVATNYMAEREYLYKLLKVVIRDTPTKRTRVAQGSSLASETTTCGERERPPPGNPLLFMFLILSYHRPKKATRNSDKGGILLAYMSSQDDTHSFHRMCKHRGITAPDIARRAVTPEEYREHAHPYRIGFAVRYTDWDKLIEDEKIYTSDPEWFKKLEELKTQHK